MIEAYELVAEPKDLWGGWCSPDQLVNDVLGPDGWELVDILELRRQSMTELKPKWTKLVFSGGWSRGDQEFPYTWGVLVDYRMWFKRPSVE